MSTYFHSELWAGVRIPEEKVDDDLFNRLNSLDIDYVSVDPMSDSDLIVGISLSKVIDDGYIDDSNLVTRIDIIPSLSLPDFVLSLSSDDKVCLYHVNYYG